MLILVAGATGVLGRHVMPRLLERGHRVRALARRPEQAEALRRLGAEPVLGDILQAETLLPAALGCDLALHLATAIPRGPGGDWTLNDRIRREGTRNLLEACARGGVRRYVQQSIVFLYGVQPDSVLVDENAPLRGAADYPSAAEMEAQVREAALDWCILRGGLFYGPGTSVDEDWRTQARQGTLRLPGQGEGVLSLVHAADMARAVVLAAERAPAGSVYNVVDDEPVAYRDLFAYLAALTGGPPPQEGGPPLVPAVACSNARLKSESGWAPAYPSFRAGLAT